MYSCINKIYSPTQCTKISSEGKKVGHTPEFNISSPKPMFFMKVGESGASSREEMGACLFCKNFVEVKAGCKAICLKS